MQIPQFIKRLAKFCDTEQSRYALGGIECKSDGSTAQLTATDGRILACVHYADNGPAMEVIVNGKELACPTAQELKSGVRFDGESLCVGKAVKGKVDVLDGARFPKYEPLFTIHDSLEGYVGVRFDAALLRKLCDLSHDMNSDDKTRGLTLFIKDQQSCVFGTTTGEDGHVARFAVMPRAADADGWKPTFPARPGVEAAAAESEDAEPAPPPETLDDDAIADAVTREPEPVGCGYDDLPSF